MKNTIYITGILFSIMLTYACAILAQSPEFSVRQSNELRHFRHELKTVTGKWYATQKADGKWQVVGEALFKNLGRRPQQIRKVSLTLFTAGGVKTRVYKGEELQEMLFVGTRDENGNSIPKPPGTTRVEPNDEAIALLTNDRLTDRKPFLARVRVQFTNRPAATLYTRISEFLESVRFEMPFSFDSDLFWYTGNTAGTYGHWPTIFPQPMSNFFLSQRYAVDFIQVSAEGASSSPRTSPNKEDYFAWNKDVKSAESGEVVAIVNDLPDMEIGQVDLTQPAGNYVVIRHSPRVFTIYAHLKQATVFVQIGQKVEKGEVIGKVGNSGNSDEPHLHFHVMDRWDFLDPVISGLTSQGLPALFSNAHVFRSNEVFRMNGNSLGEGDIVLE